MNLRSELIYLAEEIADEMGDDHTWVEQLRDLAEELKEENGGGTDGKLEIAGMLESIMPPETLKMFSGALAELEVNPVTQQTLAERIEEQILDMWESRDKHTRRSITIEKIAEDLCLTPFDVAQFLEEVEENKDHE